MNILSTLLVTQSSALIHAPAAPASPLPSSTVLGALRAVAGPLLDWRDATEHAIDTLRAELSSHCAHNRGSAILLPAHVTQAMRALLNDALEGLSPFGKPQQVIAISPEHEPQHELRLLFTLIIPASRLETPSVTVDSSSRSAN